MGFQFWLKSRKWRRVADRERKRVPYHRSDVLIGSLRQGPSTHPRNTEDASIRGWAKRARRRVEMMHLREVWGSCTRDNVETDVRYVVLNLAADWWPAEIVKEWYELWVSTSCISLELIINLRSLNLLQLGFLGDKDPSYLSEKSTPAIPLPPPPQPTPTPNPELFCCISKEIFFYIEV